MTAAAKILLVDDDRFIQRVIGKSLSQLGYQIELEGDGLQAWQRLDGSPDKYDLVLLDRDMPGMDGLSLLKQIKADARLGELPVVMLTGADQEEEVAEGLAAGAHYYLTKPATQIILQRVIEGVLETYRKSRQLREQMGRQQSNLVLLKQAVFEYRTLQEARDMAMLLADASGIPEKTVSGYSELLINAVEHGNLEIRYREKSQLMLDDCWQDEIERRLQRLPYLERMVQVRLRRDHHGLEVVIEDQGEGFDWRQYLTISPERAFDLHGRGIAMSNELSFDELEYLGRGNIVRTWVAFD